MAVLQFGKRTESDEGRQRQAALLVSSAFSKFRHVFLVDKDVDCFDMSGVLWATSTRFQGDTGTVTIPGVRCHPLDPSNSPEYSVSMRGKGIVRKTILDYVAPFGPRETFKRACFMGVNPDI